MPPKGTLYDTFYATHTAPVQRGTTGVFRHRFRILKRPENGQPKRTRLCDISDGGTHDYTAVFMPDKSKKTPFPNRNSK